MKKSFVKTVCGIVLAGVMLAATGCGNNASSASSNSSVAVVESADGEAFAQTDLSANQISIFGKVYDIPFNYSKVSKQLTLREEMTEKYNVKVPAKGTLNNVFLDVAGTQGSYIEVALQNTYTTDELPKLCNISMIKVSADHCEGGVVVLPSGITIGSSAYQITGGQYGDPDKTIDEKTGFQYVYVVGDVTYTFAFDTDKDGLQSMIIEYTGK